jgi:hypothetical protein
LYILGGGKEEMKERTFNSIKSVQAVFLYLVSVFLVSLSFTSIAPMGTPQFWGWLALAFVISSLQIVFIIKIKTSKKSGIDTWKTTLGLVFGYLLFTIIMFNGSLSFIVNTIDQKSKQVKTSTLAVDTNIDFIKEEIDSLKKINAQHQKSINEDLLPKNLITSVERLNKIIQENEVKITELQSQLTVALEKVSSTNKQEAITTDTFELIAKRIPLLNVNGSDYQFFIMLLMSLAIEFGLFISVEAISKNGKLSIDLAETKKELNKYIEALFDTDGIRLISDKRISEITNIPLKNCIQYKQMLQNQVYNNKPLIYSGKGGTKSNFSKEDVIKIMTFALNTQKIGE